MAASEIIPQTRLSHFYIGRRLRGYLIKAAAFILLMPGLLWVLMPSSWMFFAAFSSLEQIMKFPPDLIPNPWVWTNFYMAFTKYPFGVYFTNSLFISVTRVVLMLMISSLTGFAFARLRAPGRDFLFFVVLSTLMLPYTVTMIPQFVLFKNFGWINTYYPLILPHLGSGAFLIFLFRQFFRSISDEVYEAARLDGCGWFSLYWRITLPLSGPVLVTGAILVFQAAWQDLLGPLIYLNSNRLYTIPLGLATIRSALTGSPWHLIMSVSIVAALPSVILFFFGQRYLISGIVVTDK